MNAARVVVVVLFLGLFGLLALAAPVFAQGVPDVPTGTLPASLAPAAVPETGGSTTDGFDLLSAVMRPSIAQVWSRWLPSLRIWMSPRGVPMATREAPAAVVLRPTLVKLRMAAR